MNESIIADVTSDRSHNRSFGEDVNVLLSDIDGKEVETKKKCRNTYARPPRPPDLHTSMVTWGLKRPFQGEAALASRDLNSRRACIIRRSRHWSLLKAHKSQFE
jgi:hypothetical protein